MILDSHIHLTSLPCADEIIHDEKVQSFKFLAATVDHSDYKQAIDRFDGFANIIIGCGLHPWYIPKITLNDEYASIMREAPLLSEIGLDFSHNYKTHAQAQIAQLEKIFSVCSERERVFSLHSVKAGDILVGLLKKYDVCEKSTVIFHSYNGSSNELHEAIQMGCYFSVGSRMLNSRQGQHYIKIIPENRILLETDAPQKNKTYNSVEDLKHELMSVAYQIKQIKDQSNK